MYFCKGTVSEKIHLACTCERVNSAIRYQLIIPMLPSPWMLNGID